MTLGAYICLILFTFLSKSRIQVGCNSFLIFKVLSFSIIGVMIFLLFIFIMTAPYYIGLLIASFFCHIIYGGLLILDMKLIISGKVFK